MANVRAIVKHVNGRPFKKGKKAQLDEKGRKPGFTIDLVNDSKAPVAFDPEIASIPSLSLEVKSSSGKAMRLPPPPVPRPGRKVGWMTIAPGKAKRIDIGWLPPPWWPAGEYRVRFRYPGAKGAPGKGVRAAAKVAGDWIIIKHEAQAAAARSKAPAPPPPPPAPCSLVSSLEVDVPMTETITQATVPAWNGTYQWNARFRVTVDQPAHAVTIQIRVRITGSITAAQKTAWENACQNKWSNIFKACCAGGPHSACCVNGYTYVLDLKYVNNQYHYVVVAGSQTTSMTAWGAADTVDITHEVGHMLGNKEEYYTVDGVAYGEPRQPTGNIMNNPANLPDAPHYNLVLNRVLTILGAGTTGTTCSCALACAA